MTIDPKQLTALPVGMRVINQQRVVRRRKVPPAIAEIGALDRAEPCSDGLRFSADTQRFGVEGLYVSHACVCLAFGVSAASIAAQPTSRPIRQSTTAISGGQSNGQLSTRANVRYPTMLDMTFPEFEAAAKKTDIVLLPIGAIEEHSSHLPLGTDAMNATAQMFQVQEYLRKAGFDTILGPPLNIGITNERGDWTRDGTYAYPGSLTIRKDTFVALYVDVLRSLHDNGLRRAFLYIGHLGTRHVEAVVHVVEEANRTIEGMTVYAAVDSEMLDRIKLPPSTHILSVDKGRNFEMVAQLLGRGTELPRTTHADGAETSWTLHFYPEARLRTIHAVAVFNLPGGFELRRSVEESERQWRIPVRQGFGGGRQTDRRLQNRPHRGHHSAGGEGKVRAVPNVGICAATASGKRCLCFELNGPS